MRFWVGFPFVRILFFLILGILSYGLCALPDPTSYCFLLTAIAAVYAIAAWTMKKAIYRIHYLLGFLLFSFFVLAGNLTALINDDLNKQNHYRNHYEHAVGWEGTVIRPASEKENFNQYIASVDKLFFEDSLINVEGRVNLYIRKDSGDLQLSYGDVIWSYKMPTPISGPKNPQEFDYATYMRHQHIFDQQFLAPEEIMRRGNHPPYMLMAFAFGVRAHFQTVIDKNVDGKSEAAVLAALLLGLRDQLDNEITDAYAAAGAMHVLAVSGLHVGILFLLIGFLCKPLTRSRFGNYAIFLIQIVVLWCYAMITGFSPSVLRAVTMFSIIALAETSQRESNIYNTLSLSAILLLTFEPNFIYNVGFQLSYIAVVGIVFLQPRLYNLWIPDSIVVDKAWQITTVSIAAQLATFPLGIYYFNQFPSLFFISNLVIIPIIGAVLQGGLLLLLVSFISDSVSHLLGQLLELIVSVMNWVVQTIESIPNSQVDWIHLNTLELCVIYAFVISAIALIHYRNLQWLYAIAALSLTVLATSIQDTFSKNDSFVIHYALRNHYAIDFVSANKAQLISDSTLLLDSITLDYHVNPNRLEAALSPATIASSPTMVQRSLAFPGVELLSFQGLKILRVTTLDEIAIAEKIYCDQLIIGENALKDPSQLENIETNEIIFDGTNYLDQDLVSMAAEIPNSQILLRDGAFKKHIVD